MVKTSASHKPGDIVKLAGIDFVVLDENYGGTGDLFLLTVNTQGESRFGDNNNYAESDLKEAVDEWLYRLTETLDEQFGNDRCDRIRNRVIDLLTMDGHGKYGMMEVAAAPLTLEEARKYADFIPECDNWSWLATGWGGPGKVGEPHAWYVRSSGSYNFNLCSYSLGVRPALVIPSSLLTSSDVDLSVVPTDDLLEELRRRISGETE